MKLSKALKLKNRLAGEVALAQRLLAETNVGEGENKPAHNVALLYSRMAQQQEELADLKTRIARANMPIWNRITLMAELKARIVWLRTLNTKDGSFYLEGRYGTEPKKVDYHATLTAERVESDVKALSAEIERMQDEVDEFNATTELKE